MADSWIKTHSQTGTIFYVNIDATTTLNERQKQERKTLTKQVSLIRSKAAKEGDAKLQEEVGANSLTPLEENIRRAYLITNAYHHQAGVLTPTHMDRTSYTVKVAARDFHAEIVRCVTAGLDLPSAEVQKHAENLISTIKASLEMGGEQSLKRPIFIQGVLFALDVMGDWNVIFRTISVDVDEKLLQVASGGKNPTQTAQVDLTLNVAYNDWEVEVSNLPTEGEEYNGGSTVVDGVSLPPGTLPNHPLVIII